MSIDLKIGNDSILELNGLRDGLTGAYVNNATVTAILKDSSGVDVPGQTWPTPLAYVSGSNGIYRVNLEDTLSLVDGENYKLIVDANGNGLTANWQTSVIASIRRY